MHDPRVGRFFAVDPLTSKYPELSTYQFGANRLIDRVELEGLEAASDIQMEARLDTKNLISGKITTNQYVEKNIRELQATVIALPLALGGAEVATAYEAYTAWFGGTGLSSWLSTGVGASTFAYMESAYTAQGVVHTKAAVGAMSATANLAGQYIYNDFKINENINWAQPIFAGIVNNPFWSNFGQSFVNVNYDDSIGNGFKAFKNSKLNYFDSEFFSTFGSNLIGDKMGKELRLPETFTYEPIKSVLNFTTKTSTETTVNQIGKTFQNLSDSVTKTFEKNKQKGFGKKGKNGF